MKLPVFVAALALAFTPALALAQQSDMSSDQMPAKHMKHKKKTSHAKTMTKKCDPMVKTTDTRKLQNCM